MRVFTYVTAVALTGVLLSINPSAAQGDQEQVSLLPGTAQTIRTDRGARAVIIGNPLIAAASVVSDTVIAITAKDPGVTNLIALDEDGNEILRTDISVSPPAALPPLPQDGARVRVRTAGGESRGSGELTRTYICPPKSLCVLTDTKGAETPPVQTINIGGGVQGPTGPRGLPGPNAPTGGRGNGGRSTPTSPENVRTPTR